ncbi:MAG: nucleotide exchange factor GrpE [Planctomycetota bacterium]
MADKPRPAAPPASGPVPVAKKPAPAPAPARPAAPPVNVGAVVKAELKTELAPVQKAVDHVGDQIKAGLTLVAKGQRGLEEKVTVVARAVEELAKDTVKRRKDYDALYEEMRQYKTNFLDTAQKPLYNEMLLLFDSIQRIMRRIDEVEEAAIPKEAVAEAFKQVKDELLEILYRRDIEMIEDHPVKLDVKSQKPVRRVETETPSEDKDVVQVVREGFRRNGAVFRPQEVVVKRCLSVASDEQPIEPTETQAGETTASPANETTTQTSEKEGS